MRLKLARHMLGSSPDNAIRARQQKPLTTRSEPWYPSKYLIKSCFRRPSFARRHSATAVRPSSSPGSLSKSNSISLGPSLRVRNIIDGSVMFTASDSKCHWSSESLENTELSIGATAISVLPLAQVKAHRQRKSRPVSSCVLVNCSDHQELESR